MVRRNAGKGDYMKDKIKACCETCARYINGSCVLRRVHKYPWDCCARYQIKHSLKG